jgi:hypothetical protein
MVVAGDSPTHAQHARAMPVNQSRECVRIALVSKGGQQLAIGTRVVGPGQGGA